MSRISGLPTSAVVSTRQGLAVAIRHRGVRDSAGIIRGVELHGEVLERADVADIGFASMTSTLDVDCARRRDRVLSMRVFAAPGLAGHPEPRAVPGGWIQPSPQAYLADVLRSVCALRRGAYIQVASLAAEPDLPIATAAPKRPNLRPAIGLEPPPQPPPQTPPPQTPPPPAAPKPQAAKPAPQKPTPSKTAAPTPAKPVSGSGTFAVQVAAVGTQAAAEQAAKAAARRAPKGAVARVEPATVDGRGIYRAMVRGFDTRDQASRFCKTITAEGGACFVR